MKIKVLSYNIHKGFGHFGIRFVLDQLKKEIQRTHADIVLLQEVVGENRHHENEIENWPKESQFEFLADEIWPHFSYGKNAVLDSSHHGNAILSKFPIIYSENIDISNNRYEQRGLLHCELELSQSDKKSIHIFNVHLDLLHRGRHKQLHQIIKRAQSHVPPKTPFILGGDFNDWNESLSPLFYEFLGVHESFLKMQGQHAKSFPSFFPVLKLDRMYFRDLTVSLTSRPSQKPWSDLSDHLPILVEFDID